jgi:hypothetical protein
MTDPTALPPAPSARPVDLASGPLYLTMDGELMAGDVLALGIADHDLALADRVLAALRLEAVPAEVDDDGDVGLRVEDQMIFIRCIESSPPMARVFGQWVLDGAVVPELTWLRAANAVTGAVNLIKASVHGDRLVVAIDLVVAPGLALGPVLLAAVQAVLDGARTWQETVEQLEQHGTGSPWPSQP